MAAPSDQELVARTRQGDISAYGELVSTYQRSVFNICYRMMGRRRDAEDLTQEAFLRAYRNLGKYDPQRPFGPWMHTLAANLCRNALTRSRPDTVPLLEEYDSSPEAAQRGPENSLVISQQHREIYQALWELPDHHRLAVELYHFQGLSYQEIAQTLDLPLNTVRSHLYRGRQKLAELLDAYE